MPEWPAAVLARVLLAWWYLRSLARAWWEEAWQESAGPLYWIIIAVVLALVAAALVT